jgi:hypothetical protein
MHSLVDCTYPTEGRKGEAMHIIPLVGIMMPVVLVTTILVLVHRQKKREWEHHERLRAIDAGLPSSTTDHAVGGGHVVAIGAVVPVASVLAAWMTTISVSSSHDDYMSIVAVAWGCALVISFIALITSLVLGVMVLRSKKAVDLVDQYASAKPAYEPDAYDVVSRRG